ncbi:hypothetical protein MMC28_000511 [Mycoblastus sanguinarius]|nr:hypothetical protein [Mycoblastus sanguinarius]
MASALGTSIALSIRYNSSLLELPSGASYPTNSTGTHLQDWPPTPWVYDYASNSIVFQEYGIPVSPNREYEVVTAIQDIYEQIMQGDPIETNYVLKHSGNITFYLIFLGPVEMTKEQIGQVLVEVQVLFLNDFNGPQEIVRADVLLEHRRPPVAAFQITLRTVTSRTNSILEMASPLSLPSLAKFTRTAVGA